MSFNYVLAKSKVSDIFGAGECGGAVTSIFKYLLDNEIVDGVLTLCAGEDIYDGVPTFITDSDDLISTAGSLHCAPTLIGDLISKHLFDKKVAVAVKPCDIRSIEELIKRHKINPDNVISIGLNCGGTVSPVTGRKMIETYYEVNPDDVVSEEIDKGQFIIELKDGSEKGIKIHDLEEKGLGRRKNCQRCDIKIPRKANIACGNWGAEDGWTFIEVNDEKGHEIINGAKGAGLIETKSPQEAAVEARSKVENIMIKLSKKQQNTAYPSAVDADYWNRCIKCYGCRDVCPICYCYNNCEIDKKYFKESGSIPPHPIEFQGIRLSHMGFSCVDCGQCEDVCPVDIPVSLIFDKMQKKYCDRTGYIAGVSDDKKPPLYSPEKGLL
ncbi:Coenzyme F420 hydrogenase/dehydrogenase, beta subunit C-terminal domain [Methanobrevibacter oralis]|uniref:formate dehydrogenase (coenzyme F420) n=1 Tax=Methanobrevibacter oralis TaxID=66851 RepID=A0A165ZMG4_METOA|nr:Coenzyme F420 hydrogenase/dehydrogenase, beta subunit C-terminal domain [Methanobrevibacter oralis]KZX10911.1 coenzyme F420-reducing hydrogenase subunit beta [Methanobrevibacter oralis]